MRAPQKRYPKGTDTAFFSPHFPETLHQDARQESLLSAVRNLAGNKTARMAQHALADDLTTLRMV
jgi:hypothetical protein